MEDRIKSLEDQLQVLTQKIEEKEQDLFRLKPQAYHLQ
jgi:hypothetical protein